MTRVLVTRPKPGATQTANRLLALGFEPVMLPLTEIRELAGKDLPASETIDAVAITSANAVHHASPELIAAFRFRKCFAVGARTAVAAKEAGFTDVTSGPGDAAGLAQIMRAILPAGARVLYLCGHVRLSDLVRELRHAGIAVTEFETYDAPAIPYTPAAILAMLGHKGADAALLHSAKAAARLAGLMNWPQIEPLFVNTRFFCLSSRIGAALKHVPQDRIFCTAAPQETELMTLLRQHLDTTPVAGPS